MNDTPARRNLRIGDVLIEDGLITQAQLEKALEMQKTAYQDKRLGDVLIDLKYLTEEQFTQSLSKRLKVPYINLKTYPISTEVVNILDEQIARKFIVVPIGENGKMLTVAMSDPLNLYAIEEIRLATKMEITPVICTTTDIKEIINRCYSGREALMAAKQLHQEFKTREIVNVGAAVDSNGVIENAPVVKMVNSIVEQGVKLGASDIHIEAGREYTRVRLRIDGALQEQMQINKAAHDAIVTRLKIMSNMNIAEKRVPQDGRFELTEGDMKVDVRVSCLPTSYGEKMVIRILNTEDNHVASINEIGLTPHNREMFERMIKSPNGIILVTGPTGSGKSTTLYAILNDRNKPTDNIITLEDPVEKKLDGINQVQINNKAGLTFASGLRSILRQDPDVIMVGEIRDKETAEIAVRSAITGHLVFSTLHTNDAASTITRLVDMGIEPYLVSSALVGVIAQRLTRKVCPFCKQPYTSTEEENELLGLEDSITLYRGKGCQMCNFTGYKGRTGLHEIIIMTPELKQMINHGAQAEEIRQYAQTHGTLLLRENMRELIEQGVTTVEEFIKITYSID
ncbi:MAG: GspE/PulE family protein [Candidatus Niameybacter stercoravium]|nr:GspE/PulE family protein [Candidatus Niameybacter stercoravium]